MITDSKMKSFLLYEQIELHSNFFMIYSVDESIRVVKLIKLCLVLILAIIGALFIRKVIIRYDTLVVESRLIRSRLGRVVHVHVKRSVRVVYLKLERYNVLVYLKTTWYLFFKVGFSPKSLSVVKRCYQNRSIAAILTFIITLPILHSCTFQMKR